jgi:hypothetical protein
MGVGIAGNWQGVRVAVLLVAAAAVGMAKGGTGDVDPSYGTQGLALVSMAARAGCVAANGAPARAPLAFLADGSLLYVAASGDGTTLVARIDADGRADPFYALSGGSPVLPRFEVCDGGGHAGPLLRAADGHLWLGGSYMAPSDRRSAVLRLDAFGRTDPSFGNAGMITRPEDPSAQPLPTDGHWASGLLPQLDGRMVVFLSEPPRKAGAVADLVGVRRYSPDGSPDYAFGGLGNGGSLDVRAATVGSGWLDYLAILPRDVLSLAFGYNDEYPLYVDSAGNASLVSPLAGFQDAAYRELATALPGGDGIYQYHGQVAEGVVALARNRPDGTAVHSFGKSGTGVMPLSVATTGGTLNVKILRRVEVSQDGRSVYVLADDYSRTVVLKLDAATGAPDPQFGDQGVVDLGVFNAADLREQPGGAMAVSSLDGQILRLRADATHGPGLISASTNWSDATYPAVTIRVTRTAGSRGAISVDYTTADFDTVPAGYGYQQRAVGGVDYTPASGRLNWADGDVTERTITVQKGPPPAQDKLFGVTLKAVAGTPVVGTPVVVVTVAQVVAQSVAGVTNGSSASSAASGSSSGGGGTFDWFALALLGLSGASCLNGRRASRR